MTNLRTHLKTLAVASSAIALTLGIAACGSNTSDQQPSPAVTVTESAPATDSPLPTRPEVPSGQVAVIFDVSNCDECTITANTTGRSARDVPLTGGKGTTLIKQAEVPKTFFSIAGGQIQGAFASSVLITQLPGKAAGSQVTNDEVKNAKKGLICLASTTSQYVDVKAKVIPVAQEGGAMARFWADPTVAGTKGTYGLIDLNKGVAGVQNDNLC